MPDPEAQEVQARDQLNDIHTVTLGGRGQGAPPVCRRRSCLPQRQAAVARPIPVAARGPARPTRPRPPRVTFIRCKNLSPDEATRDHAGRCAQYRPDTRAGHRAPIPRRR